MRTRAILVPRTWRYGEHGTLDTARKEWEQLLRAQALEKLGLLDVLDLEELDAQQLPARIRSAMNKPKTYDQTDVDPRGMEAAANHIIEMANEQGKQPGVVR